MPDDLRDQRRDVEDRLTSRAVSDPAFRRHLLDDPHAAVHDELGVAVPSEVTITVLQETPSRLYLVLPATLGSSDSDELSDAELGLIAGGSFIDDMYDPGAGQNTAARAVDRACRGSDPTS